MFITQIESVTKAKSRVYTEEGPLFILYNRELSKYYIKENEELPDEVYQEIIDEVLTKRAKLRAMHLLQKMDRTQQQLQMKLAEGGYPGEVIEEAIAYVQSFHYQDDRRYAENYVDTRKGIKSRRQIKQELYQKGITGDTAQAALGEYEPEQERETILAWMRKKRYSAENATLEEQRKMYGFLLRKGFGMSDIMACLHMESDYME